LALIDKRQERRIGELLYGFLDRQLKGHLREALGQPLETYVSIF